MDREITTRAERHAPGETEPTLTLGQLQGLLHAAAELERAQRPIVIQPSTTTAPAPHPGIEVRIPAPAAQVQAASVGEARDIWPLVFMVSGCTGLGSGTAAIATGSQAALILAFAALAAWGTATYHLVFGR